MEDQYNPDELLKFDSKSNNHINDYEKLILRLNDIKKRLDLIEKNFLFE